MIGVLYLDSRERGALRSATVQAALETLSAEAALAIENARLYREALDKAKIDQELKVAAAIQQSLLPPGEHNGPFFKRLCGVGTVPVGRRRLLRLHRHAGRRARLHRRRHRRKGIAGGAPRRRGARHVQLGGVLPDRLVVADHSGQRGAFPARDRSAISDGVLRHPPPGRFARATRTPATTRRFS